MNKATVIIPVRIGSTRLPKKILLKLNNHEVLWHLINRIRYANTIDNIIIAIPDTEQDDETYEYCKNNLDVEIYRGSESNVLKRYYDCATTYNVKDIVRITQDCPLIDPKIIDKIVNYYFRNSYSYVSNAIEYTFPDGMDVEVFSYELLKYSYYHSILPSEKEHPTRFMRNCGKFKLKNISASKNYPKYRLTLDYPEDYEVLNNIFTHFGNEIFSLDDIIEYLNEHPEIANLNTKYKINEIVETLDIEDSRLMEQYNARI